MTWNRQRTYATLVGLGIWILLFRTIVMLTDGSLGTSMPWVSVLLVLEFAANVGTFMTAVWWWIGASEARARLPLRFTASAVVLHAVRVAIYVLGRTGPWHNFDVRPEARASQVADWHWVIFAGTMASLSLVATAMIWWIRRRHLAQRS